MTATAPLTGLDLATAGLRREQTRREITALCDRLKLANAAEWAALACENPTAEATVRARLKRMIEER